LNPYGKVIAHNRPSGILNPSQTDLVLTEKLKQFAGLMDIKLMDLFILDNKAEEYFSISAEGPL